jgi:hypothetical protein
LTVGGVSSRACNKAPPRSDRRRTGPSGPLAQRLHALRISPRQGRSTALFTLAAEVPAAILAKTLGIHVQAAIQWQKISAGDWAAYAADISGRDDSHGPAGTADARKPGPQQRAGT